MVDQAPSFAWLWHEDGRRTEVAGLCTIGRAPTNHLVLPGEKVSRRHAIIHSQDGREYWLVDLGSSNGTLVNGRRVSDQVQLRDRDEVRVAGFTLLFVQPSAGTHDPARADDVGETVRDIEKAEAWLLVADLENSTGLKRDSSPEDVAARIGAWFGACTERIERHGGILDKYLGDGFLAYWLDGDAVSGDVVTVLEMLKAFQADSALAFRMVVHRGNVSFGHLATMGRSRLFGPEVNFTFRMERLAKELGVSCLVSEAAYRQLAQRLGGRSLGRRGVSGFEGTFGFYEVPRSVPG